jgi:hypothetical protein
MQVLGKFYTEVHIRRMKPGPLEYKAEFCFLSQRNLYIIYQSVCPFVEIGTPPLRRKHVSPLGPKRGSNTCLRVRGWEDLIWTTGKKEFCIYSVLFINFFCSIV